jgi:hypothetical protein
MSNTWQQVSADCGSRGGRGFEPRRSPSYLQGAVRTYPVGPESCDGRTYNRLNADYEPMHALCRFFLSNSGPTHERGDRAMLPFLVNMSRLYELFVSEWLKAHLPDVVSLVPQERAYLDDTSGLYFDIDWSCVIPPQARSCASWIRSTRTPPHLPPTTSHRSSRTRRRWDARMPYWSTPVVYPSPSRHGWATSGCGLYPSPSRGTWTKRVIGSCARYWGMHRSRRKRQQLCLRSCQRISGNPARLGRGLKCRLTMFWASLPSKYAWNPSVGVAGGLVPPKQYLQTKNRSPRLMPSYFAATLTI